MQKQSSDISHLFSKQLKQYFSELNLLFSLAFESETIYSKLEINQESIHVLPNNQSFPNLSNVLKDYNYGPNIQLNISYSSLRGITPLERQLHKLSEILSSFDPVTSLEKRLYDACVEEYQLKSICIAEISRLFLLGDKTESQSGLTKSTLSIDNLLSDEDNDNDNNESDANDSDDSFEETTETTDQIYPPPVVASSNEPTFANLLVLLKYHTFLTQNSECKYYL